MKALYMVSHSISEIFYFRNDHENLPFRQPREHLLLRNISFSLLRSFPLYSDSNPTTYDATAASPAAVTAFFYLETDWSPQNLSKKSILILPSTLHLPF